jgi:predicted tellurium resistance membrane protein TerC
MPNDFGTITLSHPQSKLTINYLQLIVLNVLLSADNNIVFDAVNLKKIS